MPKHPQPIDHVEWRNVMDLRANDYNPNTVLGPEYALLRQSLLDLGWVQPVIIAPDGTIIDGFHRVRLTVTDELLRAEFDGHVPCVVMPMNRAEAIITTIRMNRAKGSHSALKMHVVVRELIDEHGMSPDDVGEALGAERTEVDLLYQEDVFKALKVDEVAYSTAWEPEGA